jgi:hypothetical protein
MAESVLAGYRTLDQLAAVLGVGAGLDNVLRRAESYCREVVVTGRSGKSRTVLAPQGLLRRVQARLYDRLLLPSFDRSPHSHGGVPGRSIISNALPHAGNPFLFTADIADFFPSIHHSAVLRLFLDLGCSGAVAKACTRLCTHGYHLPQGYITSPIIADRLIRPADERIARLCEQEGLAYTRFVDDITISGRFSFEKSGIARLVGRIVARAGFRLQPTKVRYGRASEGMTITGLRLRDGRPDVAKAYYRETVRVIDDHATLAAGGPFTGPYRTECQVRGRVQFICWVNPRRRRLLLPKLAGVDWRRVGEEAARRGIAMRPAR